MKIRKRKDWLRSKHKKWVLLATVVIVLGMLVGFYVFKNRQNQIPTVMQQNTIETHDSIGSFRHLDAVAVEKKTYGSDEKVYSSDEKAHKTIDALTQMPSPFAQLSPANTGTDKAGKGNLARTPGMPPVSQIPNMPRPLNGARNSGADAKQAENVAINAIFTGAVNVAILSDGSIVKEGSDSRYGKIGRIEANGLYIDGKFLPFDRSIPVSDVLLQKKENNNNGSNNNSVAEDTTEEVDEEVTTTVSNQSESAVNKSKESSFGGISVPDIIIEAKKLFGGQK